jgi:hypothetical protein
VRTCRYLRTGAYAAPGSVERCDRPAEFEIGRRAVPGDVYGLCAEHLIPVLQAVLQGGESVTVRGVL